MRNIKAVSPVYVMLAVAAALLAQASVAQQTRDGGDSARLQAAIQQLTLERSELQGRNRDLEADLEAAESELEAARAQIEALQSERSRLEGSLQQTSVSNDRNEQLAAQLRERLDEIIAEFRQTIEILRETELELGETSERLASVESERNKCAANNVELFRTGIEVLERYEEKSCFESVRQRGPFTQLKKVELENLVDEYRWRMEDEILPENAEVLD